jgi:hypothetical protein
VDSRTSSESPTPIEWHRVDRAKSVRRTLTLAALLVTGGATLVGAGFVSRLEESTGHTIALLGACAMLAGLVLGAGTALVMIQEDMYLAVRADAVVLHWSKDDEAILAWDAITAIDANETTITFRLADEKTEEWKIVRGAPDLAKHLNELKHKAAHGLL